MRLIRIYIPGTLIEGGEVALTPAAASHVVRVLRLRVGDSINVFNGAGRECRATLIGANAKQVIARIDAAVENTRESPLHVTLAQGISRGERMDFALQKATELGVHTVAPVITSRSVIKLDRTQTEKKIEHWRNIVIAACEQCGRARLPSLPTPVPLRQYLHNTGIGIGDTPRIRLVLDPTASLALGELQVGIGDTPRFAPRFELLIGPEGGLDEDELAAANQAGFISVRLGPRILRTETAAIAALAVLQARWGDLK